MIKFKTLVVDPPYMLCTGGSKHLNPESHYTVQKQSDILSTVSLWSEKYPIAEEAHCYIWGINSFNSGRSRGLIDTLEICETLGFRPITLITWVKPNGSPTPYGQRNTEMCLFGARWRKGNHKLVMYKGNTKSRNNVVNNLSTSIDVIHASRREHSRKPECFYDYVESRSRGPYLEMYSRKKRKGWTALGNQTNKF